MICGLLIYEISVASPLLLKKLDFYATVTQPNFILLWLLHQFLFAGAHMRDDIASEAYEDELDMGRSGSYLNSSITSAWSEHSLDPEDIRVRSVSLNSFYSPLFNFFF